MTLIGRKAKSTSDDIGELLLECHERIRRFIAMAVRIGEAVDVPESELRWSGRRGPLH